MGNNSPRIFSCKNEEVPVIAGFSALSLERDLADFTTYSPIFDAAYLTDYKTKIEAVQELVQPYSETVEGKIITARIELTSQEVITLANHLEGYVNLAAKNIAVKPADFGFAQLRNAVRSRDLEAVLNLIKPVKNNVEKYKTELGAVGMTPAFAIKFTQADASLADDKKKYYTMVSNRAALVQSNMAQLNDLYNQMSQICDIGKILYKQSDKAKLNDYTVSFLLKQVRRTPKPEANAAKSAAKNNQKTGTEPENQ